MTTAIVNSGHHHEGFADCRWGDESVCRIRKSGTRYLVELHVEVDGDAKVREGHDIGGRVRSVLRNSTLRIADAFIHVEPARQA